MDKSAKALVVEDENDINRLLYRVLENAGYEAKSAFSGTEAIVKISEMTKAPIIVISVKTSKSTKLELLEKGADDFICKPFDIDEVIAR